jgi:hypothetical protein
MGDRRILIIILANAFFLRGIGDLYNALFGQKHNLGNLNYISQADQSTMSPMIVSRDKILIGITMFITDLKSMIFYKIKDHP